MFDAVPSYVFIVDSDVRIPVAGKKRAIASGKMETGRERIFFVRDNGAGFDMKYAEKLFVPFERLRSTARFPGSGIGLATVTRIVNGHIKGRRNEDH